MSRLRSIVSALKRAWAALWADSSPPAHIDKDILMALADDILALFPAVQAAAAAKDTEIANLNAKVTDLEKQISDAEAAVVTLKNEITPPAPVTDPAQPGV